MPAVVLIILIAALLTHLAYLYTDRTGEQAKRDKKQESSQTDDDLT